jgi:hypothetical protein
MNRIRALILILVGMTGCSTTARTTRVFVVSPTVHDWEAAFSKLQPEERSAVRDGSVAIDASVVAWDGNVYHFRYGPPSGRPIEYERLELATVCGTYNECFAARSTNRWKVVSAVTFSGFGAENELPIYSYTFEVHLQLTRLDRTITLVGKGTGPAVSSRTSSDVVEAAVNQAFALAFLKVVVQLENGQSGG